VSSTRRTLGLVEAPASTDVPLNPADVQRVLDRCRLLKPYGAEKAIHEQTGVPLKSIEDQIATIPRKRAAYVVLRGFIRAIGSDESNPLARQHEDELWGELLEVVGRSAPRISTDHADLGPLAAIANAMAELGDVARLCSGSLTPERIRQLRKESREAREALDLFDASLEQAEPS
jgi:hypothetical protein